MRTDWQNHGGAGELEGAENCTDLLLDTCQVANKEKPNESESKWRKIKIGDDFPVTYFFWSSSEGSREREEIREILLENDRNQTDVSTALKHTHTHARLQTYKYVK